jgi:peptidoglycan hydrolase-like protein with peptidoglycan-binding domain
MTATLQTRLNTAHSQLGYVEGGGSDGHSGNITKYWTELAPSLQGQPWCAAFQRWVEIHSGGPDLPVSNPYYCPTITTYARQHGLWLDKSLGSPGDLILFQWNENGVADHIGMIVSKGSGFYSTIEGNTSEQPGSADSQRNGGGVYQRTRNINGTVLGILDYSKLLAHVASTGTAPRNPVKANPYAQYAAYCKQGAVGNQVRFVQWAVGVPVDGQFGPVTKYAVEQFQHYHKLTVDGIVGPQTIGALRSVTH